jgi:hypothetical protein
MTKDLTRFRPGSRKQAVWEIYATKGLQAAFEFGLTQGLAANTVKAWHSMWKNFGDAPVEAKIKTPRIPKADMPKVVSTETGEELTTKAMANKVYISQTKKPVKVTYSKRKAYLVEQGPQASIIMWEHNGAEDCISNEHLEGIPTVRREPRAVRRDDL